MDVARHLLNEGDTETQMVLADEQTAARGRHNRPWMTFGSPYSLMCTWIFRPAQGPHLPLIIALGLYEALEPLVGEGELRIKWPNDILLNGRKLAGILCENVGTRASTVGIGLNIRAPQNMPENFIGTFLNAEILPEKLAESINTCLQPLVALYSQQGWTQTLHNSYVQRCATIGKPVHWIRNTEGPNSSTEKTELTGLVRGLTPNGHLELVGDDGTVHVIHSGEIFDKRS